jgi:hypothetical protein
MIIGQAAYNPAYPDLGFRTTAIPPPAIARPAPTKAPAKPAAKKPAAAAPGAPAAKRPWGLIMLGAAAAIGAGVFFFGRKRRTVSNPRRRPRHSNPATAASEKFYRDFHWGRDPSSIKRVRVPRRPDQLVKLGTLESVTYSATKGQRGSLTDYVHDFEGSRPTLAADPRTKRLHIVGGGYKIEDRGIVG